MVCVRGGGAGPVRERRERARGALLVAIRQAGVGRRGRVCGGGARAAPCRACGAAVKREAMRKVYLCLLVDGGNGNGGGGKEGKTDRAVGSGPFLGGLDCLAVAEAIDRES